MKTFAALAALVVCAYGASIPANNKQPNSPDVKGIFFLVPNAPPTEQHISPEQVEEIMTQLRQEEGSDTGVYHVVLPDGRLQRVEYSTAPVTDKDNASEYQKAAPQEEEKPSGPALILAQTRKYQAPAPIKAAPVLQQPTGPAAIVAHGPRFFVAQEVAEQKVDPAQPNDESAQKPTKYVASVQYTEVQPINGPIYSYNSQPLTRVVRYAPLY